MCDVINFPKHKMMRCDSPCEGCPVCEWRAAICTTCGGAEAMMPLHCPQRRMDPWQQDKVQAGSLDYRYGRWVVLHARTADVEAFDA